MTTTARPRVNWPTLIALVVFHMGAIAALPLFTWNGLIVAAVLYVATGLGITVGFHRLFTHRGFKTYAVVRWLLAILGSLAGQSTVIQCGAQHRRHHEHSDKEDDPHSPRHGVWWAHMFWFLPYMSPEEREELQKRYAPDLLRQHDLRFISALYLLWHVALAIGLFAFGWVMDGVWTGVSVLLWGLCLRMILMLHATWAVNSAAHLWGYRNYDTDDQSRNTWWVALISFGEGWHNNHHKYPVLARHGHRWWEIDPSYWVILLLARTGLAWDLKTTVPVA